MDGCSDFRFFSQIVIPLSKPIVAVLCLWIAIFIMEWIFYTRLFTLMMKVNIRFSLYSRRILLMSQVNFANANIDPARVATKSLSKPNVTVFNNYYQ